MKHPGDPTPRSVSSVLADRSYKTVVSERPAGQFMYVLVVLHCGSEKHWMATYPPLMKPNDAMTRQQVEPIVEARTTYRPVP